MFTQRKANFLIRWLFIVLCAVWINIAPIKPFPGFSPTLSYDLINLLFSTIPFLFMLLAIHIFR